MAKMLWDDKADPDALVNEWMAGVYGPAAKPMRAWFDLLHAQLKKPNSHFTCYVDPMGAPFINDDVLKQGDQLFDQATTLAANDPVATEYVTKSRLWLEYPKLMRHPTTGDEFKQFMATVHKLGIQQISEGQGVDAWAAAYEKAHTPK
jgi:hypothetical protein